jgi:hypothetical protein
MSTYTTVHTADERPRVDVSSRRGRYQVCTPTPVPAAKLSRRFVCDDEVGEIGSLFRGALNRVAAPMPYGSNSPKADSRTCSPCATMYGPAVRRKAER